MAPNTIFTPMNKLVEASAERNLLELAMEAGVELEATCGGQGTCGQCRVLPGGEASPPTEAEARLLGPALARGVRLACQTYMPAGGAVSVPPESLRSGQVILTKDQLDGRVALSPAVETWEVSVPKPHLSQPLAMGERLREALTAAGCSAGPAMPLGVLRRLPEALEQGRGRVSVQSRLGREVLDVLPADQNHPLGLAVDLGSTTVVAYLYDLTDGLCLAVEAELNPQIKHGDDVISRITHCAREPGGATQLGRLVVESVNRLAEKACQHAGVRSSDIMECVMVGNTAMHHLFLGLNTAGLGASPFATVESKLTEFKAREVGLRFHPESYLVWLPIIAGFVGADTVGAVLATGLDRVEVTTLLVDLGTNGEMVLATPRAILCCSSAAGPAFEGGHVRHGMRGAPGAVDRVVLAEASSAPACRVIGQTKAAGICGSGLVSLVAQMLSQGLVTPNGILEPSAAPERIRSGEKGLEYLLLPGEMCASGEEIIVSGRDIAELQLAKAAVRAGIEIMMAEMGVRRLDRVFLAGAFGSYLDPADAAVIGLLPPVAPDKIRAVGNAAGKGAVSTLLDHAMREAAQHLSQRIGYLELATHPWFASTYAKAMKFK